MRADCAPADTAAAAAIAITSLASAPVDLRLERLGEPANRYWRGLSGDDAAALVRAELTPGSYILASFGTELPSKRGAGLSLHVCSAEYVALSKSAPLEMSVNPCDLETPESPGVGHTDFDRVLLGFVGGARGSVRVWRALCDLDGGMGTRVRDGYAAYYARPGDLANALGVSVPGADLVAALELAAAELLPHRRVNARVTRLDNGGVLLSLTPFRQTRHTVHTLAPLVDAARAILGA